MPYRYAYEILDAKTTEDKRAIFQTVPEKFKESVIFHVQDIEMRREFKRQRLAKKGAKR